jgi:hypothetical protein
MKPSVSSTAVFLTVVAATILSRCGGASRQPTPGLTISTASLPNGTAGAQYSQTIQASGGVGPYNWTVSSGALPHNLELSSTTASVVTISGTPDTTAQGIAFSINVTDSASHQATQAYSVSILPRPDNLSIIPASLTFVPQVVGSTNDAQTETLTNTGASVLNIAGIALSGANSSDFNLSGNTCGATLAGGASCILSLSFKPSQLGPRSASVSITDDTGGSPQTISLSGAGLTTGANATLAASSLNFGSLVVNSTSSAQSITLSNYGRAALNITNIAVTTNFGETDNCVPLLASTATCTIYMTFTPSTTGTITGTLIVTDDAPGSKQSVSLSGTGTTSNDTLTGYCWGGVLRGAPNQCGMAQNLAECPAGQAALAPTTESGCLPPASQLIDFSRPCRAMGFRGQTVVGHCVARYGSTSSMLPEGETPQ